MLSPAMSPVESPSVATAIFSRFAPRHPPGFRRDNGARWKMGGLFYSHKIYDYKNQELPPNIKVIRKPIGLRESR